MQVHGVRVTALLLVPMADIANHPSVCSSKAQMWLQNNPPSSPRQPLQPTGGAGDLIRCATLLIIRISGKEGGAQRRAKMIPKDMQLLGGRASPLDWPQ